MKFLNSKKMQGLLALTYIPLEPLNNAPADTYNSLSTYLNLVFKILISIGAMIAVVTLVFGGITYMTSEVVGNKEAARKRMQAALIGLFLLLTCWLILHEINPNLTQFALPGIDNQNYNPGNLPAASNNGTNVIPPPTPAQITDCENPNGFNSGKKIHYFEAGSWACL